MAKRTTGWWIAVAGAAGFLAGCDGATTSEPAAHPRFSLNEKADGVATDVRFIQGIGTQAVVRGRFQSDVAWRGFTLQAQAGQTLHIRLAAQAEQNGFLVDRQVPTQVLLYGPADAEDAVFEQVVADSGLQEQAALRHEVRQDGWYLVAATRQQEFRHAQFELEVECKDCQQGPEDPPVERLCKPGRLFVEGAKLRTQAWEHCEVVVLEPTELPESESLTIGPDVHVRAHYYITDFHPEGWGEVDLRIAGELTMKSTEGHPIVFESNVPGKQWRGLQIRRPETHLAWFVLRDTHGGLSIQADGVTVTDAELELNQVGIDFGDDAANVTLERLYVHDNHTGIRNVHRTPDGRNIVAVDLTALTIRDSEIAANERAIELWTLKGSLLEGLHVHDNTRGIFIRNSAQPNEAPDDFVIIADSRFERNGDGIRIQGNAVVDGCRFEENATFGVLAENGWQKVKNSRFHRNGAGCSRNQNRGDRLADCGAVAALGEAHTVIRNNVIAENAHFGVALVGRPEVRGTTGRGTDPAVLNNRIEGNGGYGVALIDAPVYSVELNHFEKNGPAEIGVVYTDGGGSLCRFVASGSERIAACRIRRNRLQQNNIFAGKALLEMSGRFHAEIAGLTLQPGTGGDARALVVDRNYLEGVADEELAALAEDPVVDVDPVLEEPDPMAGLIRPLDD